MAAAGIGAGPGIVALTVILGANRTTDPR